MRLRLTLLAPASLCGLLMAQQSSPPLRNNQAPADTGLLIQSETKVVLVDAVVTNRKGEYLTDLKLKDFHVREDGKEQALKTFAYEADPANGPPDKPHYMVLLFDNANMNQSDQSRARQAATRFIDANAGPGRMMSVVNFGGTLHVAQNFTADPDRLKKVVNGIQFGAVDGNDTGVGTTPLLSSQTVSAGQDFAARDVLLSLRTFAHNLAPVPGRKIVVWLTAGFPVTDEQNAEAAATVSECNKANVAIYPIDVRGVSSTGFLPTPPKALSQPPSLGYIFQTVAYTPRLPFAFQAKGGGSGGAPSGGTPSGGTPSGGGRGGAPGSGTSPGVGIAPGSTGNAAGRGNPPNGNTNGAAGGLCPGIGSQSNGVPLTPTNVPSPCNPSASLIGKIPDTATTNQQIMYMLSDGTGGFVIRDSNDVLAGLEKIAKEQNQYYILGYTPPFSKEGNCHTLQVKVDRSGAQVRARTGYCSPKPPDPLKGDPLEQTLISKMANPQSGPVGAGLRLPFFYTSPNVARVNLAMDLSTTALKFEKKKDVYHTEVNLLGIAYTPEGAIAARFSDTVMLNYPTKEDAEEAKHTPLHYENQFNVASGKYTFKIAFSEGGQNFGKLEMPLEIDPFAPDQFAISGLALSKEYHRVEQSGGLDMSLIEDKTPLIADGLQVVPIGGNTLSQSDLGIFYVELYEPLLAAPDQPNPPVVAIRMRVLDRKTGEQKSDTGMRELDPGPPLGNSIIPLAERMPISSLGPGAYQLEVIAGDSAGHRAKRTADFDIQ